MGWVRERQPHQPTLDAETVSDPRQHPIGRDPALVADNLPDPVRIQTGGDPDRGLTPPPRRQESEQRTNVMGVQDIQHGPSLMAARNP